MLFGIYKRESEAVVVVAAAAILSEWQQQEEARHPPEEIDQKQGEDRAATQAHSVRLVTTRSLLRPRWMTVGSFTSESRKRSNASRAEVCLSINDRWRQMDEYYLQS